MKKRGLKCALFLSVAVSSVLNANVSQDNLRKDINSYKSKFVRNVYSNNSYQAIWIEGNSLSPLGKELLNQIKSDKTVAPDLPFYKLYKSVSSSVKSGKYDSSLELKLTRLYKQYMDYLVKGEINWSAFKDHIASLRKKYDYQVGYETKTPPYSSAKILENAILSNSFNGIFNKVEPHRFRYKALKSDLVKFLHTNWKTVGKIGTLNVGSSSPAVPIIRKRLQVEGDLKGCTQSMDSTVYDSCMAKAVKRFKIRHGMKPTSTIGKRARLEFNRSPRYYVRKMRLNLDRIKWSNRKEGQVRIELNIPSFRLYLYDGNELVTTMRVITGRPTHPTPVFSNVMTTVVVNPYWRIPESIVKNEMIKHLLKDPHHYERQHKFLYNGWGPNSKKIDPATVNWRKYYKNKKPIPYHFMQSPGVKNALGKIKFLFPNKYSVYIHDTPGKYKFFKTKRAFSHGCMRIQKPRELLEALSLYNSNLHVNSIMKRLGTDDNKAIGLRRKIPVDITYFTAYVDNYGYLHFRDDVYGYDRAMLKNYAKSAPSKTSIKHKSSKKKAKHTKKHTVKPNKKDTITTKSKKSSENVVEIGY